MSDRFEERLRKMAEQEKNYVPESFSSRIDQVLEELPRTRRKSVPFFRTTGLAAAAVAFLILLPNLNEKTAYAMSEIPILGPFFEAVTFRSYEKHEENQDISIQIPEIVTEDETEGIKETNARIQGYITKLMDEFYTDLNANSYLQMQVGYQVITSTDQWFTLDVEAEIVMASSTNIRKFYHIYVPTGEIMELSDLFREGFDYKQVILDEIKEQMRENMKEDPNISYWNGEKDIVQEFDLIAEDHNFYFNEEGKLVIPFDDYEVGPGSMGSPEFILESPEIYQNLIVQP
ncbi:MAG: DUF3298 domain-containing protein [Lachnospiraceae bacterium]|nr:DUF3298 domain-containing protein [Lachnospiraceae bacterium]